MFLERISFFSFKGELSGAPMPVMGFQDKKEKRRIPNRKSFFTTFRYLPKKGFSNREEKNFDWGNTFKVAFFPLFIAGEAFFEPQ